MEEKPIKLGELLITAGALEQEKLNEAVRMAGETGLPIGRILIMSGYLTDGLLQAAIDLMSLVKDKELNSTWAVEALKLVCHQSVPLGDALNKIGFHHQAKAPARLGELLIRAELISQDELNEALSTSRETGLPLGRVLVLTKCISDQMLSALLTAQVLLRDGKISEDQAIQGLRASWRRRVNIETSLADEGTYAPASKQTVKLGELFVLSGLVAESDLMNALEIGLDMGKPVGQVLIQGGFIPQPVLEAALKLQQIVASGTLNALQASEALRQVATKGASLDEAASRPAELISELKGQIKLGDILKAASIITDEDIRKAIEMSAENSALIGKMLLVTGMIDEAMLNASLRCQFLLREGLLTMEQAITALNRSCSQRISFDDAAQELGFLVPSRL